MPSLPKTAGARTRALSRPGNELALALPDEVVESILARLRRVEGQVRAVQTMIEQRRDCHEIAHQMSAARSALDRATVQLMIQSMAHCVTAGRGADDRKLNRLTETFVKLLS